MNIKSVIIYLALSLTSCYTFSKEVKSDLEIYEVNGYITEKTFIDFKNAVDNYNIQYVQLNSEGGYLISALNIGFLISREGLNTYVPEGMYCASACGYIFFSGKYKILRGKIGIHEFSVGDKGYSSLDYKSKVLNTPLIMTISNYLGVVGVHYNFLLDSLQVNKDEVRWLSELDDLNKYLMKGYLISD